MKQNTYSFPQTILQLLNGYCKLVLCDLNLVSNRYYRWRDLILDQRTNNIKLIFINSIRDQSRDHFHIYGYEQAYKKYILIGRHFACAKRLLENSSGMLTTVRRKL